MNARDARRLLLVQAFEQEADVRWTAADARWATDEARRIEGGTAADEALLARRTEQAAGRLIERDPALARWLDDWGPPGWVLPLALAAAFATGLALDGFGGHPRINVLALPLIGLIGWNLVVYLLLGLHTLRALAAPRSDGAETSHGLRAALARVLARLAARGTADGSARLPALSRFGIAWADAARALHTTRVAAALHALAAALALGLVTGLYLRGLAFEYRAGWESTFLDADRVHALLSVLLGPAAALIGDPLPSAAQLAALRFPASDGENAAPWIHRIAVTVGLVVVVPRLVLAAWATHRARAMERSLPIDLHAPYFERLLRELRGERTGLRLQPFDHRAATERDALLRQWLAQALGSTVQIDWLASVSYGDEPVEADTAGPRIVVFNASTTPEDEVHVRHVRRLGTDVQWALVDETDLRQRATGADAEARIDARRRAWRTALEAAGIDAVFCDLNAPPSPDAVATLGVASKRSARATA